MITRLEFFSDGNKALFLEKADLARCYVECIGLDYVHLTAQDPELLDEARDLGAFITEHEEE